MLCATLMAYWPALTGEFIWDDNAHVTTPAMRSLAGLWRIWSHLGATQQYYPLLHSAFWVEHRLWGDSVLPYHLTNVVLHVAAACLVVMIARRLSLPGAWLAGFIFALHPVCVEAVAWISEQKSTLSGVFYLGSALAYLHYDESRRRRQYLLAFGLFVLALLTKTVTATLPAALLVVLWWRRGRLEWKRDVEPLAPWLVLGAGAGLFTAWVEKTYVDAEGVDYTLTILQHLLLAGRALWFYAGKLVWPADLIFNYPRWTIDPAGWKQYVFPAGVSAVLAGLCLAARRRRGPLAGFLFFAGTLFPVLGFLNVYPFKFSYVADHFQYLASLGVIVPAASALAVAAERFSRAKEGPVALAAVLLAVLGVLTWRQSAIYQDPETLYWRTLARNPTSYLAHNNLCTDLLNLPDQLETAIAECRAAVRVRPGSEVAHTNLGSALSRDPEGLPAAIAEYQTALRIRPAFAGAHNNLGSALVRVPGRLTDAIAEFEAALRTKPDYLEAHANLGAALTQIPGRAPDAIAEFQAALRIDPDHVGAHLGLGSALAQVPGRAPDALAEFETALRIDPNSVVAHMKLAYALSQLPGRLPDAIDQYRIAVRLQPDSALAHYNLGRALSDLPGRQSEAMAEFVETLRIDSDFQSARQMLERLRADAK